jgi:hypothetical protein
MQIQEIYLSRRILFKQLLLTGLKWNQNIDRDRSVPVFQAYRRQNETPKIENFDLKKKFRMAYVLKFNFIR